MSSLYGLGQLANEPRSLSSESEGIKAADDSLVGGMLYCWVIFIADIVTLSALFVILRRMKMKRRRAQAGEEAVKMGVILPAYESLLWMLFAAFAVLSICHLCTLMYFSAFRDNLKARNEFLYLQVSSVACLALYSYFPVLLIQKTVTMKAFRRAWMFIAPWLIANFGIGVYLLSVECTAVEPYTNLSNQTIFRPNCFEELRPDKDGVPVALEVTYALIGPIPPLVFHFLCVTGRLKSRVELRSNNARMSTLFATVYSAIFLSLNLFATMYNNIDSSFFIFLMQLGSISLLIMNLVFPFALYKSLLADTKFWRGLGRFNRGGLARNSSKSGMDSGGGEIGPVSMSVATHNLQNMMSNSDILVDFSNLKIGKKVGKGSTATVYQGRFKKMEVAVKVFLPPEITEEDVTSFSKEASLAATLIHENIVRTLGICVRPPSIALICEFCLHGNLGDFMRAPEIVDHVNDLWRFRCAIDAVAAVMYLHSKNILHRDLKADNYFLNDKGTVKLGDFGESTLFNINSNSSEMPRLRAFSSAKNAAALGQPQKKMTIVGTVSNMAPEMINADSQYTEAVDIYSLAVTLWEIWTVLVPFEDFNQFQIYKMVGEAGARPNLPAEMNDVYKTCVNAAWGQDASFRPSAAALHLALCKEHDRLNASLQRVKEKWIKLASKSDHALNEEERRMSRAFSKNMPEYLPEAFKVKSNSDKSFRTPSKANLVSTASSRRQTFLQSASHSFVGSRTSVEPNSGPTEDEREEQIKSGDIEAKSNTISLDAWMESHPKQRSSKRVVSVNPLAEEEKKRSTGDKMQAVLSRTMTRMESFKRKKSLQIRRTSRKLLGGTLSRSNSAKDDEGSDSKRVSRVEEGKEDESFTASSRALSLALEQEWDEENGGQGQGDGKKSITSPDEVGLDTATDKNSLELTSSKGGGGVGVGSGSGSGSGIGIGSSHQVRRSSESSADLV